MRKQRYMFQMKEQNKTTEKEINKMETSNLPDTEFRAPVIRICNEFKGRIDELSENIHKEIEIIKK